MFTDILVGLGSMIAGGSLALLPYLVWPGPLVPGSKRSFLWLFLIWGALWIGPGIQQYIHRLK